MLQAWKPRDIDGRGRASWKDATRTDEVVRITAEAETGQEREGKETRGKDWEDEEISLGG